MRENLIREQSNVSESVQRYLEASNKIITEWKLNVDITVINSDIEITNDLLKTLTIWIDKYDAITSGELLLFSVNIVSLFEMLLKLFLTIYSEDYYKSMTSRGHEKKKIKPTLKVKFETQKSLLINDIMKVEDKTDYEIIKILVNEDVVKLKYSKKYLEDWLGDLQERRNHIHLLNGKFNNDKELMINDIKNLRILTEILKERLDYIESPGVYE